MNVSIVVVVTATIAFEVIIVAVIPEPVWQ